MNDTSVALQNAINAFNVGDFQTSVLFLKQAFDANGLFLENEAVHYVSTFPVKEKGQFWKAPEGLFGTYSNVKDVFESIYENAIWGGGSGAGSDLSRTVVYVAYVQHIMDKYSVKSVVDIGCGDWRFSKYIDFSGCKYLGVDIVESVISANIKNYGNNNIIFQLGNATEFEIPKCDLLLCKDVLQHLSNKNVRAILHKSRVATRALFTNDFYPVNEDCNDGDTRPLNIASAPFDMKTVPRLAFNGKVTFLVDTIG